MDANPTGAPLSFREKLQLQLQRAKEIQKLAQKDLETSKSDATSSTPSSTAAPPASASEVRTFAPLTTPSSITSTITPPSMFASRIPSFRKDILSTPTRQSVSLDPTSTATSTTTATSTVTTTAATTASTIPPIASSIAKSDSKPDFMSRFEEIKRRREEARLAALQSASAAAIPTTPTPVLTPTTSQTNVSVVAPEPVMEVSVVIETNASDFATSKSAPNMPAQSEVVFVVNESNVEVQAKTQSTHLDFSRNRLLSSESKQLPPINSATTPARAYQPYLPTVISSGIDSQKIPSEVQEVKQATPTMKPTTEPTIIFVESNDPTPIQSQERAQPEKMEIEQEKKEEKVKEIPTMIEREVAVKKAELVNEDRQENSVQTRLDFARTISSNILSKRTHDYSLDNPEAQRTEQQVPTPTSSIAAAASSSSQTAVEQLPFPSAIEIEEEPVKAVLEQSKAVDEVMEIIEVNDTQESRTSAAVAVAATEAEGDLSMVVEIQNDPYQQANEVEKVEKIQEELINQNISIVEDEEEKIIIREEVSSPKQIVEIYSQDDSVRETHLDQNKGSESDVVVVTQVEPENQSDSYTSKDQQIAQLEEQNQHNQGISHSDQFQNNRSLEQQSQSIEQVVVESSEEKSQTEQVPEMIIEIVNENETSNSQMNVVKNKQELINIFPQVQIEESHSIQSQKPLREIPKYQIGSENESSENTEEQKEEPFTQEMSNQSENNQVNSAEVVIESSAPINDENIECVVFIETTLEKQDVPQIQIEANSIESRDSSIQIISSQNQVNSEQSFQFVENPEEQLVVEPQDKIDQEVHKQVIPSDQISEDQNINLINNLENNREIIEEDNIPKESDIIVVEASQENQSGVFLDQQQHDAESNIIQTESKEEQLEGDAQIENEESSDSEAEHNHEQIHDQNEESNIIQVEGEDVEEQVREEQEEQEEEVDEQEVSNSEKEIASEESGQNDHFESQNEDENKEVQETQIEQIAEEVPQPIEEQAIENAPEQEQINEQKENLQNPNLNEVEQIDQFPVIEQIEEKGQTLQVEQRDEQQSRKQSNANVDTPVAEATLINDSSKNESEIRVARQSIHKLSHDEIATNNVQEDIISESDKSDSSNHEDIVNDANTVSDQIIQEQSQQSEENDDENHLENPIDISDEEILVDDDNNEVQDNLASPITQQEGEEQQEPSVVVDTFIQQENNDSGDENENEDDNQNVNEEIQEELKETSSNSSEKQSEEQIDEEEQEQQSKNEEEDEEQINQEPVEDQQQEQPLESIVEVQQSQEEEKEFFDKVAATPLNSVSKFKNSVSKPLSPKPEEQLAQFSQPTNQSNRVSVKQKSNVNSKKTSPLLVPVIPSTSPQRIPSLFISNNEVKDQVETKPIDQAFNESPVKLAQYSTVPAAIATATATVAPQMSSKLLSMMDSFLASKSLSQPSSGKKSDSLLFRQSEGSLLFGGAYTPSNAKNNSGVVAGAGLLAQTQFSNDSFGITPKKIDFFDSAAAATKLQQSENQPKQSEMITPFSALAASPKSSPKITKEQERESPEKVVKSSANKQKQQSKQEPSYFDGFRASRSQSKSPKNEEMKQESKPKRISPSASRSRSPMRYKPARQQQQHEKNKRGTDDDDEASLISSISNLSKFDLDQPSVEEPTAEELEQMKKKSKATLNEDLARISNQLSFSKHNKNQLQIIDAIYNENQNISKVMLNQSGKNILYQTLALLDDSLPNHFIIVVTSSFLPLRTKMNKSVSWACINSVMGVEVLVQVQNLLMEKKIKLLFIQQEYLLQDTLRFLKNQVKMIFFEDQTDKITEIVSMHNIKRVHLFQTTCFRTKEHLDSICSKFSLVNLDDQVSLYGFDFANMHWTFETEKEKSFINFIRKNNLKKVIMYIDRSKKIDEIVSSFNQKGLKMHAYNPAKIENTLALFVKDSFEILCCYNGQTIPKSLKQLVQYYIHYHLPRNVLSYLSDMNGFQFYHLAKGGIPFDKFSCGFLTELDYFEIRSAMIQDFTDKKLLTTLVRTLNNEDGNNSGQNNSNKKKATTAITDDFFFNVVLDETEKKIQDHYNNMMNGDDKIADEDAVFAEGANVKHIQITKFTTENCIKRELLLKMLSYLSSDKVQIMPFSAQLSVTQKPAVASNKIVNHIMKFNLNKQSVTFSVLDCAQQLEMTSQELNRALKKLSAEKKVQYDVKEEIAVVALKPNIDANLDELLEQVHFQELKQISELDTMYLAAKITCNLTLEQVFKYQKYKETNKNQHADESSTAIAINLKQILEKYLNTAKASQELTVFTAQDKQKLPFISLKSQREKSNLIKDILGLLPRITKSKLPDFQLNRDFSLMDFEAMSRFVSLILQGIDAKNINEFKPTLQFKKYFRFDYFDVLSISNEFLQAHYLQLLQSETTKKIKI